MAMTRARDELILSPRRGLRRRPRATRLAVRARGARPAGRRRRPGRRRARRPRRSSAWRRSRPRADAAGRAGRPDHRAAVAELLPDRRLPDLPAQVQVRPRPAGPARPAPRDRLRRRPAQGRPALPPPPRQGPRDERGRARRGVRVGLVERGVREPRPRGGAARAPGAPRCAGSARRSSQPDAVIPTYVEREFSFTLGGDRVRGRWDRVDVEPIEAGQRAGRPRRGEPRRAPTSSRRRSGSSVRSG